MYYSLVYAVVAQLVEQLHGEFKKSFAHCESNFAVNPELRLISCKGQDRGEVKFARTTDKGLLMEKYTV